MKEKVRRGYMEFRELCSHNTSMIVKCIEKLKEDGLLKYLDGMNGITSFEAQLIKQTLKEGEVNEIVVKHPLPKSEYTIEEDSFRVSENHPYHYLFKYDGDIICSVQGMDDNEAYDEFCRVCKEHETVTYK